MGIHAYKYTPSADAPHSGLQYVIHTASEDGDRCRYCGVEFASVYGPGVRVGLPRGPGRGTNEFALADRDSLCEDEQLCAPAPAQLAGNAGLREGVERDTVCE